MAKQFFGEQTEQSEVKATIVSKYFWAWATVVKGTAKKNGQNIAYVDLFAGPGRYENGSASTPLMVLERAIEDPDLSQMLVSIFNDADKDHSKTLQKAIDELPGIKKLKNKPDVHNDEVGDQIVKDFEGASLIPTFSFVDPFGYKGLSLRLINAVLKDWGCDCVFFFNYNRINMGVPNKFVVDPINELFGEERANKLRAELKGKTPDEREARILEAIVESLQEMGGQYVLPFRFKRANGKRTSHHLIFVTKHPRGYEIMKEIMARESSGAEQGVPTLEYNPAFRDEGLLFELNRPLDDLEDMLLEEYAGETKTMQEIYADHNIGRRFIKSNYKEALRNLEAKKLIICDPQASERRVIKGVQSFADGVNVTFKKKKR